MAMVYGIGNPLMDLIMTAGLDALEKLGVVGGSMNLVEADLQRRVIELGSEQRAVPGGSCANTMRGIAFLSDRSIDVAYGGAVGADPLGRRLSEHLREGGVRPMLATVDVPTGSSAIIVTPDHERTMFTHLGACRSFTEADLSFDDLNAASILHLAGYMWDTTNQRDAALRAVTVAREAGTPVSFDIADSFVVERYHDDLRSFLPGSVDLLFGNLDELRVLTGEPGSAEQVAVAATAYAPLVALKVGSDGCLICKRGEPPVRVAAAAATPVDTTGAGDAFAAGFLVGYVEGRETVAAARLANSLAAAIVEVSGCSYELIDRQRVLERAN